MGAGRGHLLPAGGGGGGGGGGGEPLAQKSLVSCPNFYETVEEQQGSNDKLT